MSDSVCCVSSDQLTEFLLALLIVASISVVKTANGKTLALSHPVEMTQGFSDVLVGILQLAKIPRHGRQSLIAEAEAGIQFHGLQIVQACLFELAVGLGFDSRRVVTNHLQRSGRHAPHGKLLSRV